MNTEKPISPYIKTQGLYYFARLLHKIRLREEGKLTEDYINNLGKGFDARCLSFLDVPYEDVIAQVKSGADDEVVLEWCFTNGHRPSEEEILIWNEFMRKFGWNDAATSTLQRRMAEGGFHNRPDIQTIFDYIDLDEGREKAG